MRAYREQDFEKMADRIVGQFLSGKAKLADAAAQEAIQGGLNPDQIERLTQSANTMAFLKMMDQRKQQGAGDLMHEFDPIDSRHVIRLVIDQDGVHVEPMDSGAAQGMHGMNAEPPQMPSGVDELPDEMRGVRMNPAEGEPGHEDSPEVESCEEDCHEKLDPPGVKTKKKAKPPVEAREGEDEDDDEAAGVAESPKAAAARVMRTRKLAAVLEDQYRQAAWAFEDEFAKLERRFKIIGNPVTYAAFEKDAMMERSDQYGVAVLNALRASRGLPALEQAALEKNASLADHHISDDTQELRMFERLASIAAEADKLRRGTEYLRAACA